MTVKRSYKIALILVLLVVIGAIIFYWNWSKPNKTYPHAPNFTLPSIQNSNYTFGTHSNKIRFVEFFYAECPDICPMTTSNMVRIQNTLKKQGLFGNKVQFISITIDPTRDTQAVLTQYTHNLGIDQSGWVFLRGTESSTQQVTKEFGLFVQKDADGFITHSTRALFLIDQNNNIRDIYEEGEKMPTKQIEDDMIQLAKSL